MIGYNLNLRSGKDSFSKCLLSRHLKGEEELGWLEGLWGGQCDWTEERSWGRRSGVVVLKHFKLHLGISMHFTLKPRLCVCACVRNKSFMKQN